MGHNHHISAVGGGSGMHPTAGMGGGGGKDLSNAVSGLASQLGVDRQQLGGTLSGLISGATSGDQSKFGQALGSLVQMLTNATGQQAQGGGGQGVPASTGGSPAAGPSGAPGSCSPSPASSSGGSPQGSSSPLDMLAQLLQALGVPPQLIQQIMGAVMSSMQAQGGGGAMQSDSVPGVQAA